MYISYEHTGQIFFSTVTTKSRLRSGQVLSVRLFYKGSFSPLGVSVRLISKATTSLATMIYKCISFHFNATYPLYILLECMQDLASIVAQWGAMWDFFYLPKTNSC